MRGILLVNKRQGWTSFDAVNFCKRVFSTREVGHLGTLDPLATGVLPIAVGRGTKLFNLLLVKEKTYRAFFTFGLETDTLDSDGVAVNTCKKIPNVDEIKLACKKMIGKQDQLPPMYSAKSVNGTRAYILARKGETVELKTKEI